MTNLLQKVRAKLDNCRTADQSGIDAYNWKIEPIIEALLKVAEEHEDLIKACEWMANNPLEHERNHFFAIEARGNYGIALSELEKAVDGDTEKKGG